jgi:hypothetical protein
MAKTGDAPDRKPKPKPRARGARPSFAQTTDAPASSAWVYRSDAPAAPAAKVAPAASAPVAAAPVAKPAVKVAAKPAVKPVAKPVADPAASSSSRAREPIGAAPVPAAGSSRVVHALDVVTWPLAVSLMAVLAPMRRLLGPSSR